MEIAVPSDKSRTAHSLCVTVILFASMPQRCLYVFLRCRHVKKSSGLFASSLESGIEVMLQGANEQLDYWMDHHGTHEEGPLTWSSRNVAS